MIYCAAVFIAFAEDMFASVPCGAVATIAFADELSACVICGPAVKAFAEEVSVCVTCRRSYNGVCGGGVCVSDLRRVRVSHRSVE